MMIRPHPRLLVLGVACLLGAAWLVPAGPLDENRTPAIVPPITLRSLASGSTFHAIDAALDDRIPAKSLVVSTLGGPLAALPLSPSPAVVRGDGGTLFFSGDFTGPCFNRLHDLEELTQSLQEQLAQSGTRFLYAIPPDKSAVERDLLTGYSPGLFACSDRNQSAIEALADQPGSPFLVAWDEFAAHRDEGLYLTGDSHWNSAGASLFAGLVIDRLARDGAAPGVTFAPNELVGEHRDHTDDLYRLMGVTRTESTLRLESVRAGVATTHETELVLGFSVQRWMSTSAEASLVEGRTLILHDSFFAAEAPILAPYFADLTALPLDILDRPGALAAPDGYDLVLVMQVQRSVPTYIPAIAGQAWIMGAG
jgi:hypothetical protein